MGGWAEPDQPKRPRSVRGGCGLYQIKVFARPARAPWEEAPTRPPKSGHYDIEESKGKVQGSAREGRYGICVMRRGLA